MGKLAVRPVCVCGDFVNWPGAHGVDWVKLKTALHTDILMVHKTPLGTGMGCACLSGQHGVWFLVVAGASWGCAKSVVNLAISPHASANPTIPQQIVCLHEGLSLQVTQGGAERCKRANWELGLRNALHYSVSKGVIQRKERGPVKCNLQFK